MNVHIDRSSASPRPLAIVAADAQIIMGRDEAALLSLWRAKRGEGNAERPDKLVLELAKATEAINRAMFERRAGRRCVDGQRRLRHPALRWMGAVLDGRLDDGSLFAAEFSPTAALSPETARALFFPAVQHSLWVAQAKRAVLSVLTGDGGWVAAEVDADPLYQHLLLTAEKRFRACVEAGEAPSLFVLDPPAPHPAFAVFDMGGSPDWVEAARTFRATLSAFRRHEGAREALERLTPREAYRADGEGVAVERSPFGPPRFALLTQGGADV
jgi:hypothetical protein